jgi:uncharacterized protein
MGKSMDDALVSLIRSCPWLMRALEAVRDSPLPDAWIGAGVLRDLVWGERHGAGFRAERVRDVDVVFFDPHDLSRANDDRATALLEQRLSGVPWEAKNQAAVHTWYAGRFGGADVAALTSIEDAVGTWPETATAVAVRLTPPASSRCALHSGSRTCSTAYGGVTRAASACRSPVPGCAVTIPAAAGRV